MFSTQDEFADQTFEAMACQDMLLAGKHFLDCTFLDVHFNDAIFKSCRFEGCIFQNCDLSNAVLSSSSFRRVTFQNSKLLGIDWSQASQVMHLNFDHCQLSYSIFNRVDLRKTTMQACIAREAEFSRTNLSEAVCCETDFAGSRFEGANLTKADFRRARNYVLHPTENVLKETRFSLPEALGLLHGLDILLEE